MPRLGAPVLVVLWVLFTAGVLDAHPRPLPYGARYRVWLEDAAGHPLPTFRSRGTTYVLGELGRAYAVRVENPTPDRIEAVVTVDGRDVITGGPGNYQRQRGYVIAPYDSVRITGFRQSLRTAATFRFSSPGESYTSRMGTPENVGVIGVAVFTEATRTPPAYPDHFRRSSPESEDSSSAPRRQNPNPRAGPAPKRDNESAGSSEGKSRRAESRWYGPRDNLGTEYGETHSSDVHEVSFRRRRGSPEAVLILRYDDATGLRARGIRVDPPWYPRHGHRTYRSWPAAFPENRFAPPPP